ncbi:MAG: DUF2442 domain-containing protein [Anaerolineales bacterium]|nr:DUF2442 domain-containing protein [Anaerolineales bacterium]
MGEYSITNPQIFRVTAFEIVDEYTLHLTFNDQSEQIIDFEPILLGPVFSALKKRQLFNQVALDKDFGTLIWPNGADIEPNVLHDWPDHVDAIIERRKQALAVNQ